MIYFLGAIIIGFVIIQAHLYDERKTKILIHNLTGDISDKALENL